MRFDKKKLTKNIVTLLLSVAFTLVLSLMVYFSNRYLNKVYSYKIYIYFVCSNNCEIDEELYDKFIEEVLGIDNINKIADVVSDNLDTYLSSEEVEEMLSFNNYKEYVVLNIKHNDIKVIAHALPYLFDDSYVFDDIRYYPYSIDSFISINTDVEPYLAKGIFIGLFIGFIFIGINFKKDEKDLGGYVYEEK